MKKFFNNIKFNIKNTFWYNIFQIVGVIFIIIILTIIISELNYQSYIKSRATLFENVSTVSPELTAEEDISILDKYQKLGWIFYSSENKIDFNNQKVCIANEYIFKRYDLPLAKGRMPKNEGEGLAPWKLRKNYELGKTYNLKNGYKFKIVGYTINGFSISINYPLRSNIENFDITILSNQELKWYESTHFKFGWYFNYEIPKEIHDKILLNKNLTKALNLEQETLKDKNNQFIMNSKDSNFGMSLLALFGSSLFIVFLLANSILKTKINKLNIGLCYLYGQSKKDIVLFNFYKNLLNIILIVILTYFIVLSSFSIKGFLMTWKGWGISIGIVGGVLIIMAIIDYIKLRKTDFSEILNYRE